MLKLTISQACPDRSSLLSSLFNQNQNQEKSQVWGHKTLESLSHHWGSSTVWAHPTNYKITLAHICCWWNSVVHPTHPTMEHWGSTNPFKTDSTNTTEQTTAPQRIIVQERFKETRLSEIDLLFKQEKLSRKLKIVQISILPRKNCQSYRDCRKPPFKDLKIL